MVIADESGGVDTSRIPSWPPSNVNVRSNVFATIKSDPKGSEYDRFLLEWVVKSYWPITKFKVEYKGKQM